MSVTEVAYTVQCLNWLDVVAHILAPVSCLLWVKQTHSPTGYIFFM
jgi:hypothetical protein